MLKLQVYLTNVFIYYLKNDNEAHIAKSLKPSLNYFHSCGFNYLCAT